MALILAVLASSSAAEDQFYGWDDPAMQAMDKACLSGSKSALQSKFEGSNGFEHQRPQYWPDAMPGITVLIYSNTKFFSSFGDVEGSITCIFDQQKQEAVSVGFQFDDRGLAGLKNSVLSAVLKTSPEEQKTTFLATALGGGDGDN